MTRMFFRHKKIAIIFPERLGDVLMCTPALRYFKFYYPFLKIDAITFSLLSFEVLQNNPALENRFLLPHRKTLQTSCYDAVINFHEDNQQGRQYAHFLNAPVFCMEKKDCFLHQAEQGLLFIQNISPDRFSIVDRRYYFSGASHAFETLKDLLNPFLNFLNNKAYLLIGCHIGCHGLAKKRFLGLKSYFKKTLHPKVWPLDYFIDLAQKLQVLNPAIKIVITGSRAEKKLAQTFCQTVPSVINLVDKISLAELYALMKRVRVFITPDSGPLHLACCANVPTVALFGPTSVKRTGPYPWENLSQVIVMQAENITTITPDHVLRVLQAYDFFRLYSH